MKRSPAEKIADATGSDLSEVLDGRYKRGTLTNPAIYVVGEDYYAGAGEKPPPHKVGQPWQRITTWRGDTVWESKMDENGGPQ